MKEKILKLHGKVKHYAWGGHNFIPELLSIKEKEKVPFAEYWMGAHPSFSSEVEVEGKKELLYTLLQNDPKTFLGSDVFEKFGELPYLFKVLDVKEILSIQVHPSKEEAIKGYDAEEAAGIPINAVDRNYRDKNHKPEVMIALSDFWLLHGFRPTQEIRKILNEEQELNFLLKAFGQGDYYSLYKEVMELTQERTNETLLSLIKREISKTNKRTKNSPGYWVNKLYSERQEIKDIDKGIFSFYFFNIVQMQTGEAIFQGAGIPHAYLEGQNVELMSNSDNVLRGGLTSKHINIKELLKHIKFEAVIPDILKGEVISDVEKNYPCPVDDFAISAIELEAGQVYHNTSSSPEIYIIMNGSVKANNNQPYIRGESFFVIPKTEIFLIADNKVLIYKAFLPSNAPDIKQKR